MSVPGRSLTNLNYCDGHLQKKIYDSYISNYNSNLYGENSLARIAAHFPALKYYYGRHLPKDKNAMILDIGCGDGNFVYWMQQAGYTNAHGIDLSAEQV